MVTSKAPLEFCIDELLGPPAHVRRSDLPKYRKVHEQVRRALNPKDFIGELNAREFAVNVFEEMMLKRYQANLVKSMLRMSCQSLLDASGLPPLKPNEGNIEEQFDERIEMLGITEDIIEANAFNLQRDAYEITERLIGIRSRARSRIEKRAGERSRSIDINPTGAITADGKIDAKQHRSKRS